MISPETKASLMADSIFFSVFNDVSILLLLVIVGACFSERLHANEFDSIVGRWLRRPGWLTGLALFFVLIASAMLLGLRMQPVVPTYSRLWQPIFQTGANLLWIGDGWNWYISGLLLLAGGLGISGRLFNPLAHQFGHSHESLLLGLDR